jgi:hypothetical protein
MVANNKKPTKDELQKMNQIVNPDELMHTIFMPDDLNNLRLQYARWQKIQMAEGNKDEIGILGFLSIIMKTGMGVTAMRLIDNENRLGL